MRIALAQIAPALGDTRKNFDLHAENIARAKKEKADLVIFPELSLTGYSVKDMVESLALRPETDKYLAELKSASADIAVALGFVEEKAKGQFYNSAAYLAGGAIVAVHRKVFLPTYGMFEEARFFAQGKNFRVFDSPLGKTGLMICRDFLSYGAHYLLFAGGAEAVLILSAAPGRGVSEDEEAFVSSRMWTLMGEAMAYFSGSFIIYCNRAGIEDGISFAGGSFVFDPWGKLVAKAKLAARDLLFVDIDPAEVRRARKLMTFKRDDKPEVILEALKRVVASYED